jgi:phosphohistidine phosphatase
MKKLFLVRHAQAETPGSAIKDFDRELVASGISEAAKLGKKLAEKQIRIDKMISSDAARAQQTAKYISEQISYPLKEIMYNNDLYEASVRRLINIVNTVDEKVENLLLIGHNPGLSDFVEMVTGETIGSLPTAGLVKIEFEIDSWKEVAGGNGVLRVFDCPYS